MSCLLLMAAFGDRKVESFFFDLSSVEIESNADDGAFDDEYES